MPCTFFAWAALMMFLRFFGRVIRHSRRPLIKQAVLLLGTNM